MDEGPSRAPARNDEEAFDIAYNSIASRMGEKDHRTFDNIKMILRGLISDIRHIDAETRKTAEMSQGLRAQETMNRIMSGAEPDDLPWCETADYRLVFPTAGGMPALERRFDKGMLQEWRPVPADGSLPKPMTYAETRAGEAALLARSRARGILHHRLFTRGHLDLEHLDKLVDDLFPK